MENKMEDNTSESIWVNCRGTKVETYPAHLARLDLIRGFAETSKDNTIKIDYSPQTYHALLD